MDFELKAAKAKWEREQIQKKEEAKAKLQREKKAREEAARLREALETAQAQRRLQEAQALAAAQAQEEMDLFAGDGIRFNVILQARPVSGDGDKIKLPPSAFEYLSSQGALEKGPMYFEIGRNVEPPTPRDSEEMQDSKGSKSTHCGVLDFTAPEGYAELPHCVFLNIGLPHLHMKEGPLVRIRYVRLPKCTYAKLLPDYSEFADVPNHKAVLETTLRQHATLSQGDFLLVQHEGLHYRLQVLELKPSTSVSVLETDVEVDVVSAAGMTSQSRLAPLELGKPQNGYVEEGSYSYYKFVVERKVLEAVNNGNMNLVVYLDINEDAKESDADLYVAAHPILFPSQHQHHWASHNRGSKVIFLNGKEKALQASSFSVAVYGYRGKAAYKIWVQSQPAGPATGQRVGLASREMEEGSTFQDGFEVCENCKQVIPSKTVALHEAYCRRHNRVCSHPGCGVVLRVEEFKKHVHCSKCGQSLQEEELEKHLKVYHEPHVCKCGAVLEMDDMVKHQQSTCPLRTIMCKFCGDMVQAGKEAEDFRDRMRGLTQHESQCGSRTSPCEVCGRSIMLKEMDLHQVAVHDPKKPKEPAVSRTETSATDNAHLALPIKQTKFVNCPICNHLFEGATADSLLNTHLDDEHFSQTAAIRPVEVHGDEAMNAELSSSYKRSLSVACPICGLAVHSERDLSVHMDMVH